MPTHIYYKGNNMTTENILIHWLKAQKGHTITYQTIENQLSKFGVEMFNMYHNAGTYTRAFRKLKEKDSLEININTVQSEPYGIWRVS